MEHIKSFFQNVEDDLSDENSVVKEFIESNSIDNSLSTEVENYGTFSSSKGKGKEGKVPQEPDFQTFEKGKGKGKSKDWQMNPFAYPPYPIAPAGFGVPAPPPVLDDDSSIVKKQLQEGSIILDGKRV